MTEKSSNRLVIAILLASAFVVILNETTLNVALTSIMTDLGVDERAAQWLTTAFMLTMAVVIPVTGWLLERLRTRQVFLLAMGLFIVGTLGVAIAPTFPLVLLGRVVQASGTAVMMPLLMTTVMNVVEPSRRGVMMGNISMVISVAPAMGPTVSGIILKFADWRMIFVVILPLALALTALGWAKVQDLNEARRLPVDGFSVALAILGFGGVVYSLSLIGDPVVPVAQFVIVLVVGALSLGGFLLRQVVLARTDRALLNLGTFRVAQFRIGVMVVGIAMMAMFGTLIMLPLILQKALFMEPLQVGLMLLPGGLVMGLLGPVVGKMYDQVGPRPLVIPAAALVGAMLVLLSFIDADVQTWYIVLCHMGMSIGFAFMFTPLMTSALGSLPRDLYSHGSATVGTVQQVAGAIGTALFVTIFSTQTDIAVAAGQANDAAMLTGSRIAFLAAASVWGVGFIATFWVRSAAKAESDSDVGESAGIAH